MPSGVTHAAAMRLLRSRYGAALLAVAVISAIVAGARLVAGEGTVGGWWTDGRTGAVLPSPEPDDGVVGPLPTPTLRLAPGAPAPEAVALAFTAAWLNHHGVDAAQWLAGLRPYATRALLDSLTGADPAGVPADRITGQVRLVPHSDSFAEAVIPVDSGTVRLRLLGSDGRWRVDGVDWERT